MLGWSSRPRRKPKIKPSYLEIAGKTTISAVPQWGGPVNQIINGLQQRRKYAAETALGAISERVGQDAFLAIVEGNPEIEAMLYTALQAIMQTGMESKRKVLREVVINAMTSDEPIDMEQMIVTMLDELDAPHIRALARLSEAKWLDRKAPPARLRDDEGNDLSAFAMTAKREPTPVLSALIRTGVVFPGDSVTEGGLGYVPRAGELTVSGVSEFGEDLLDYLRAADTSGEVPPGYSRERAESRAFIKELQAIFDRTAAD